MGENKINLQKKTSIPPPDAKMDVLIVGAGTHGLPHPYFQVLSGIYFPVCIFALM